MSDPSKPVAREAAERLSLLMDGELDAEGCSGATAAWGRDAAQRGTWHAYHLIGDVLRSEDLAGAARDEAFMQKLRLSLAREPVALVPRELRSAVPPAAEATDAAAAGGDMRSRRRLRWAAPFGVAAGVAAVAVTAWVTRLQEPAATLETSVAAAAPRAGVVASGVIIDTTSVPGAALAAASQAATLGAEPVRVAAQEAAPSAPMMLRNPQVDRYLSAHRGYAVAPGLGQSASFIRGATFEVAGK